MRSTLKTMTSLALAAGLALGLAPAVAQELSSGKTLKYNPKFPPPSPMYSDLMSAIQNQVVWKEGRIQMNGRLRAMFFPDYKDPSHSYPYNNSSGARLAHQVKKADGTVVSTQFYSGQKLKRPFWMMHPGDTEKYELEDGEYTMEFFLEGKPFHTFPFTVRVKAGADAYTPDSKWYLDGPWEDLAYIYIPRGGRPGVAFSVWLRDEEAEPGKWGKPQTNVVIKRDGKVLSFWPGLNEANPLQLKPWYIRYDISPRSKKGSVPTAEYTKDASYEIVLTMDGKVRGTYKYQYKGGKFVHHGAQIRDKTDPLLFIEGGGERFFIKRQ